MVRQSHANRFIQSAWKDIHRLIVEDKTELSWLRCYFETKTAGLRPAFNTIGL
jgi:hypothetical protein